MELILSKRKRREHGGEMADLKTLRLHECLGSQPLRIGRGALRSH